MTAVLPGWDAVREWLVIHAPTTSRCLNVADPGAPGLIERHLGLGPPEEVTRWFATVSGARPGCTPTVLPGQVPHDAYSAIQESVLRRRIYSTPDSADSVEATMENPAGGMAWAWLPQFVPIGYNGSGDGYFIDLRPGDQHGCIKDWHHDDGALYPPVWANCDTLLGDVLDCLEHGRPSRHWMPRVNADLDLNWDIND